MTFGVVMVIALSGLGCHNVDCDVSSAAPGYQASAQSVGGAYVGPLVPAGQHHHHHPSYSSGHSHSDGSSGADFGGRVYSTLYSFVFGRDPDVPTVREIESNLESGEYERATMDAYRR